MTRAMRKREMSFLILKVST